MPNHVTTRCTVTGPADAVAAFVAVLFTNADEPFSFDLIRPMPPILSRVISPVRKGPNGRTMLNVADDNLSFPGIEATEAEQAALDSAGSPDWYQWAIDNWGTKWDAYRVEVIEDGAPFVFKFETAWSFPVPIFAAMTDRFPLLTFDCVTFDEGWNFAGKGQFGADVQDEFETCEASAALYEAAYGYPPEKYEDD